jgi:hypothetical protein
MQFCVDHFKKSKAGKEEKPFYSRKVISSGIKNAGCIPDFNDFF